ncbi:13999_t:CDS:2, partial [Racocetra fulgida]
MHPGNSHEVSKIASKEWENKTLDLDAFLKSYTKKKIHSSKRALKPAVSSKRTLKTSVPSKRELKTDVTSKQVSSADMITNKVCASNQVVKTTVSSKQIISVDMFINGIPPTPMQRTVPDQAFNIIEGNNNVVYDNNSNDYK